jgi:hypothetical protein
VINRRGDPRTADRIVFDLLRSVPPSEAVVIGRAVFRDGTIEVEADPDVEVAVSELMERPFVDRVQADERPRGYRRSREGQVDLLVPGMPEHFIARMRGLWLSYPDGSVVTARAAVPEMDTSAPPMLPEAVESSPPIVDPAIRRASLAVSDETAGGRPLVRPHAPLPGDRPTATAPHRTDCGWLT